MAFACKPTVINVYQQLLNTYGPQGWWPGESGLEVIVGAILTQATAWGNAEKAIDNLKEAQVLSAKGLKDIPENQLALLLRPSGFFKAKAVKIRAFVNHLWAKHGGHLERLLQQDTQSLRHELLSVHGIGEETADAIILYAANKPAFVIDAYTRRMFSRLGLTGNLKSYREHQEFFHSALAPDRAIFSEYHALIVKHSKEVCLKQPRCAQCCLLNFCAQGRQELLARTSDENDAAL